MTLPHLKFETASIPSPAIAKPAIPQQANSARAAPLTVEWVGGKGRGVIATRDLSAGEIVEKAPAMAFSASDRAIIDQTVLFSHYFVDPTEYHAAPPGHAVPAQGYIAFGLSSICNHAATPSGKVNWRWDPMGLWADLLVIRDLPAGGELTVFYTNILDYPDHLNFQ